MKRLSLLALTLLAGLTAQAQSVKDLDEKYGFRDLKFGADTTEVKDIVAVERHGGRVVYARPADKMTVGEATLNKITYTFDNGKLVSINLITNRSASQKNNFANSRALRNALEGQYGEGEHASESQDRTWKGQRVIMTYREAPAYYDCKVRISTKEFEEGNKANNQGMKKKTSDL